MSKARTVPEKARSLTDEEAINHIAKGFTVCIADRLTLQPNTFEDRPGPNVGCGLAFKIADNIVTLDRYECELIADLIKSWAAQSENR